MADFVINWDDEIKFERALSRISTMPQKISKKAGGQAANAVRRSIRSEIPVGKTGQLRRGIIRVGERSRYKGKKIYDLMFDPDKNGIFQKDIKHPGEAGGKRGHAYYPASMEYGFLTRSKGKGLKYVEGRHFMRDATDEAAPAARQAAINTATRELNKEWVK